MVFRSVWANPGNRGQRLTRSLAALGWQIQKRTVRKPRLIRLRNGVLFHAHPDCVVSSALIYSDWPEYPELMYLRSVLRRGEWIVDVGANVGHISLLLADCVGPANVLAFEPSPTAFGRLVENWRRNGWGTDNLVQAAIGDRTGWAFVDDTAQPTTTNRVHAIAPLERSVKVPLLRLDDVRERLQGRRVGLLKIDVEGFEPAVFDGARQFLREDRPRVVMFESLAGEPSPEIARVLQEAGYVMFQLNRAGRPDLSDLSNQNLFAVPSELRADLQV